MKNLEGVWRGRVEAGVVGDKENRTHRQLSAHNLVVLDHCLESTVIKGDVRIFLHMKHRKEETNGTNNQAILKCEDIVRRGLTSCCQLYLCGPITTTWLELTGARLGVVGVCEHGVRTCVR